MKMKHQTIKSITLGEVEYQMVKSTKVGNVFEFPPEVVDAHAETLRTFGFFDDDVADQPQ